jgi:hypothetical protein
MQIILLCRDWKELLEFEGEVEFNLHDVRASQGLSYLYFVHGSAMDPKEFLYGAPDEGHSFKDRYLRWPKDMEGGKLKSVTKFIEAGASPLEEFS